MLTGFARNKRQKNSALLLSRKQSQKCFWYLRLKSDQLNKFPWFFWKQFNSVIFLFLLMEAAKVQICQHYLSSTTQEDIKGFSFSGKEIVFVRNQFVSTEKCFPLGAKSFFQEEERKKRNNSAWVFGPLISYCRKTSRLNHSFSLPFPAFRRKEVQRKRC